jgi:hypothetical protein
LEFCIVGVVKVGKNVFNRKVRKEHKVVVVNLIKGRKVSHADFADSGDLF